MNAEWDAATEDALGLLKTTNSDVEYCKPPPGTDVLAVSVGVLFLPLKRALNRMSSSFDIICDGSPGMLTF